MAVGEARPIGHGLHLSPVKLRKSITPSISNWTQCQIQGRAIKHSQEELNPKPFPQRQSQTHQTPLHCQCNYITKGASGLRQIQTLTHRHTHTITYTHGAHTHTHGEHIHTHTHTENTHAFTYTHRGHTHTHIYPERTPHRHTHGGHIYTHTHIYIYPHRTHIHSHRPTEDTHTHTHHRGGHIHTHIYEHAHTHKSPWAAYNLHLSRGLF